MGRSVHNEYLDSHIQLTEWPTRVVSLVSSATEGIDAMGELERVVGVSEYCHRYVDTTNVAIVGQYMTADIDAIVELQPDLVLLTTGVQRRLSQRLLDRGLPVYNLALPTSFEGILENYMILGGLLNVLDKARALVERMRSEAMRLRSEHTFRNHRLRVYVELWLGRHRRAVGGLSYIVSLLDMAGCDMVYQDLAVGYFENEFDDVEIQNADAYLFFHEPEYLVDGDCLVKDRGWNPGLPVLMSTVQVGDNVIQDGPSMFKTARWIYQELSNDCA